MVYGKRLAGTILLTLYGALWGVMIELIATKALKAPMRQGQEP